MLDALREPELEFLRSRRIGLTVVALGVLVLATVAYIDSLPLVREIDPASTEAPTEDFGPWSEFTFGVLEVEIVAVLMGIVGCGLVPRSIVQQSVRAPRNRPELE